MRFVLNELLDVGEIATLPGYEDATPDVIDAMIEEGAKLCENTLLPLNRPADEEGCHYENGVVRTPQGLQGRPTGPSSMPAGPGSRCRRTMAARDCRNSSAWSSTRWSARPTTSPSASTRCSQTVPPR